MADIDIDELIRQFGSNYPKWVNDAIGARLETTNKILKDLQKQKSPSNPEMKKEIDNRKLLNKELRDEKKLISDQNKAIKDTNDLYKNLKSNLGGLVKNLDKFKKDLDTMAAQSNSKELAKQSKEISKETAARKELTKTVDRQTINQVTYILTQKELNKTTRILDQKFGGLSKTIDVLIKKINTTTASNATPMNIDYSIINKSMMSFQRQMDSIVKNQDDFAKKINKITTSLNEPRNATSIDIDYSSINKSMMAFQRQMDNIVKNQDDFAKKINKITTSLNEPRNDNNVISDVTVEHKKFQKSIVNSQEKLDKFSDKLDKTARSVGDSIQSFGDIKNLGSATSGVIVGLLGSIPKIGLAVAGVAVGTKMYIDEMMIARTAFQQLSTNGFGLGTDLKGLSQIARDGRMTIEDLSNAMAMNKTAFMALGQDAASVFSKLQADANDTGSLFKKFGMFIEETNEFLSNNLEYQRTTGRLRNLSDAQRSALAEQELMRLAKTQSVFGKSIKEITSTTSDYMQQASTIANVVQITRGMSAEDKQRVMGTFTSFREQVAGSAMTPEMQDMTMKMIAVQIAKQEGRPLLDKEQQEMALLMKQMPELSSYIEQSVAQGNAQEEFTKDLNTILKDSFVNNSEALDRLAVISTGAPDQKLKPMADAILASIGQVQGFDETEAQKRIDATAAIANNSDATLKAITQVEKTIANVESAFKDALVNVFGQNFGNNLVDTITTNLNQVVDTFKVYVDKVTDPNYNGSIVSDEVKAAAAVAGVGYAVYKASRFGNSIGERLANRLPTNRVPPVTQPAPSRVPPVTQPAPSRVPPVTQPDIDESSTKKLKSKLAFLNKLVKKVGILGALYQAGSGFFDEEYDAAGLDWVQSALAGLVEGGLGTADLLTQGGAKFSNYIEGTDEYYGSDFAGMFRDWVTGKNKTLIPEFDPSTNIPEHLKNGQMVGGVGGITMNPDGSINRGGSVVNSWRNTSLQGGSDSNTLPSSIDDEYQGGLSLTPGSTNDLLLPMWVLKFDDYESMAQAHYDKMSPFLKQLHDDNISNLFVKNTDTIDSIFTKSLDKFLFTKRSIESIITASSSEHGLSETQMRQLDIMGMGGGLIPRSTTIGGPSSSGSFGGGSGQSGGSFGGGYSPSDMSSNERLAPLLDLIGKAEGAGYNTWYGGIKKQDLPSKKITEMTAQEILDFQDSIDSKYISEAVGKYQIMEDTLRPLVEQGLINPTDLFNEETQDKAAQLLLQRRGLNNFLEGNIQSQEFGNNIAKEWAQLPVITGKNAGRSYYQGDIAGNKQRTSISQVMEQLTAVKNQSSTMQVSNTTPQATRPVARPNSSTSSAEVSMTEVDKLRQSKLQAATMAPDRNEPIKMTYTTSEEEAKEKDRLKAMGASNKEVYDDHILRELRQISNETKRNRRATEKNGAGLAPGAPSC